MLFLVQRDHLAAVPVLQSDRGGGTGLGHSLLSEAQGGAGSILGHLPGNTDQVHILA
jgi:hypothetical protein